MAGREMIAGPALRVKLCGQPCYMTAAPALDYICFVHHRCFLVSAPCLSPASIEFPGSTTPPRASRMFVSTRFRTFLFAAFVTPALAAQQPKDGTAVLERMRAAYAGKWYHTLTFTQKTTTTRDDGTKNVSTWYESLRHTPAAGVQ